MSIICLQDAFWGLSQLFISPKHMMHGKQYLPFLQHGHVACSVEHTGSFIFFFLRYLLVFKYILLQIFVSSEYILFFFFMSSLNLQKLPVKTTTYFYLAGFFMHGFPKLLRFQDHHDNVLRKFLPKIRRHLVHHSATNNLDLAF